MNCKYCGVRTASAICPSCELLFEEGYRMVHEALSAEEQADSTKWTVQR